MIPGMNPKQMQQMMKQMGVQQVDVPAEQVIIRTAGKDIIISNPQVAKVTMMGQQTWQITGNVSEQARVSLTYTPSAEDIETVMASANVTKDKATAALLASKGDIAEAILHLTQ